MVYDGTDSGLNNAVWVPNFGLPITNTVLQFMDESTYMADLDIGEMFLNFMMPEELCEEVIRGYKKSPSNLFHWKQIRFNLPCSSSYTQTIAWVSKVCDSGDLASGFAIYIDDVRTGGTGKLKCQQAT
eukprot:3059724-Ditylum_brightwellii.AAC.2